MRQAPREGHPYSRRSESRRVFVGGGNRSRQQVFPGPGRVLREVAVGNRRSDPFRRRSVVEQRIEPSELVVGRV